MTNKYIMCLLVILFTHGINFAEDVKKNNFKEERSEYIPTENSLKIKSPSDKSKIFTDELINLKWEYKTDEKDKSGNVKIELSLDSGKNWVQQESVKSVFNSEQTQVLKGYKNSCIVKIKISDKKDSEIQDEITLYIVNPIDISMPIKGDANINNKSYISWNVNYDDIAESKDFKIELSTNNGVNWMLDIPNNKIIKTGRSYSLSYDTPDSINSELCVVKITDTKNKKESGQSGVFSIVNIKNDNYGFRIGGNFDVFDKKISDFYMSGRISEKNLGHPFGLKWWKSGINLQLTSGTGHSEDSTYNSRSVYDRGDTIISSAVKSKSDIYNVFLSASFTSSFKKLEPFYFIFPHLEYRRSINRINNKREDVVLRNSIDTSINSESNFKKTNDIWYVGIGIGTVLNHNIFKFTGEATIDYNTAAERINVSRNTFSKQLDVVFRFNLQETNTEINLGGELIYPLIGNTSISTPVELSFYLSKDISIKRLYDSIVGTSK